MPRGSCKHFRNPGEPGEFVFVTTTCLDFVHAFADPTIADLMAASLLLDCRELGAKLHAFVVMPHHVHMALQLPLSLDCCQFMDRIKSYSARRIRPRLARGIQVKFGDQTGLNKRVFWMRSFRSSHIKTNRDLRTKMRYIHANPVRAGLVKLEEDYRWSSARLRLAGQLGVDWELAIDDAMVQEFAATGDLAIKRKRGDKKPSTLAAAREG